MLKLKGKVNISRVCCSHQDDYIQIEIDDDTSGCRIVRVEMSPEQFALAVTGMGGRDAHVDYYDPGNIGKKREIKVEYIDITDMIHHQLKDVVIQDALLAPHTIDGWEGRSADLLNHHQHNTRGGITTARVTFVRWVDAE